MKLKVGDRIYRCYRGEPTNVITIERTTKTQAISGTNRFKIEYSERSWINVVGRGSYSQASYYLETPRLIEKFNRIKLLSKVKTIKFDELTDEQLKSILNVL